MNATVNLLQIKVSLSGFWIKQEGEICKAH